MKQTEKTKQQLIRESEELRLQINQLKASQQHNLQIEQALFRRDKILEAAGYLADHMLKTGDLDQGLQGGLQRLGVSTGVSRVYIFQNSMDTDGQPLMSQRYEWTSPSTNALIDNPALQNVPYISDVRRLKMKELLEKGNVYSGQTPFFSEEERSSLEFQSILALAIFPIFVENEWWGFIGFDDCETPRVWSSAEIGALRIAAGTIGSAIQREKAQKALLREQFNLEVKIRERTSLLTNVNIQLQQEIEEKKQIEKRLQKSREWLDLALNASNTGLWDWDVRTGKVVANEWYYTMLGLNPDMNPHSFKAFEALLHPDDRENTVRSINRHIEREPGRYELEFRIKNKTDDWVWVMDRGKVVERDSAGNPLRVVGTHTDITIRRKTEEALKKSEERFQLALEAANDGIWDWNVTTGRVVANPRYYTMLGLSPELNPSSFDEFETWIHPEDREHIVSTIQSFIQSKDDRYELEFRMGSASEGWHWILDKAKVVERDSAGNPLRVVGTHS
ncbi:MAG: PAS domain-containing protein, partial [Deltaproteobacteria bacterium]|nr:PAS domain-containing protein [Deltaproteobacteria bacterium]